MTEKKTTSKSTNKKVDFEKKFEEVKETTSQTTEQLKGKLEKIFSKIWAWRSKATDEEKIYMILWIILLLIWVYVLRGILWWLILIWLGLLFVTGFFVSKKK